MVGDVLDSFSFELFGVVDQVIASGTNPFSFGTLSGNSLALISEATFDVNSNSVNFDVLDISEFESFFVCGSNEQGQLVFQNGGTVADLGATFMLLNPQDVLSTVQSETGSSENPFFLPAAQLSSLLPSTPFSLGPVNVEGLDLTVGNGQIEVTGNGKAEGFDIGFSFVLLLEPGSCFADAVLQGKSPEFVATEVSNVNIWGDNPSFWGFFVNAIVDFLSASASRLRPPDALATEKSTTRLHQSSLPLDASDLSSSASEELSSGTSPTNRGGMPGSASGPRA
ncbi:MAG: hypothetical protein WB565_12195 [Acidimicrobiales bacterium]